MLARYHQAAPRSSDHPKPPGFVCCEYATDAFAMRSRIYSTYVTEYKVQTHFSEHTTWMMSLGTRILLTPLSD